MITDPRFPVLTQKQINTLKEYGTIITFEKDTVLFQVGDSEYDFFIVLEGEIIVQDEQNENRIVVHGINEFSGDNSLLSNRSIPFSGSVSKGSTVLRIKPPILKEIIS